MLLVKLPVCAFNEHLSKTKKNKNNTYTIVPVLGHTCLAVHISQLTLGAAGSASHRSMEKARLCVGWYDILQRKGREANAPESIHSSTSHDFSCSLCQKKAAECTENRAGSVKTWTQNASLMGTIAAPSRSGRAG